VDQLLSPAALGLGVDLLDFPALGDCGPPMKREAGLLMKRENPTPEFDFLGLSTHETRMTIPRFQGPLKMSDNGQLSDIVFQRQARRITWNRA
jgi:hypothetical protein